MTRLFFAGGLDNKLGYDSVSVKDLAQPSCQQYPADLPEASYGAASLKSSTGNPVLCGGQRGVAEAYAQPTAECVEYIPEIDAWERRSYSLSTEREYCASADIGDGRTWIVGGHLEVGAIY